MSPQSPLMVNALPLAIMHASLFLQSYSFNIDPIPFRQSSLLILSHDHLHKE